jgi:hypothetical protein
VKNPVNFVLMGDSRVRNLYEHFKFMLEGSYGTSTEKPHYNINSTYQDLNFKLDFLWGPQTETGNQ